MSATSGYFSLTLIVALSYTRSLVLSRTSRALTCCLITTWRIFTHFGRFLGLFQTFRYTWLGRWLWLSWAWKYTSGRSSVTFPIPVEDPKQAIVGKKESPNKRRISSAITLFNVTSRDSKTAGTRNIPSRCTSSPGCSS